MFPQVVQCAALLLALFAAGCTEMPESDPRYCDMSDLPPVWIIEDERGVLEEERKDLDRDRGIEKVLVIPVYRNYRHAGGIDRIAIAHAFLYRPGDEIEAKLRSFGQRDKLAKLVLWAHGYFPSSIGGNFIWSPVVKGRKMIVKQLQRCVGSEDADIRAAMKELLEGDSFVVGGGPERPRIPETREVITVEYKYNAAELVRSIGYDSRFSHRGYSQHTYALWACEVGTKIANRLSPEEKKMAADFAAEDAARKSERKAHVLEGTYTCDVMSLVFEHGKCFCIDRATNQRFETKYLLKGHKLYIAPIVPEGKKMIRNAWPVYTIKGDTLESSHVEDMDTGEIFYKDQQPKLILKKQ